MNKIIENANLRKVLTPSNEWEVEDEKCIVENPSPKTCAACPHCKKAALS